MSRPLKIAIITLTAIIVLLVLSLALISQGFFNADIKTLIIKNANNSLNATLTIEKIEGNPLANFAIKEISISQNDSQVVAIKSITIEYDIWQLWHKKIHVSNINIDKTNLRLTEGKDSLWNIQKMLPNSTDTTSQPSDWKIEIGNFELKNITAYIQPLDTNSSIPKVILLNAKCHFSSSDTGIVAELSNCSIATQKPDFSIEEISVSTSFRNEILNWKNLLIQLPNSTISSQGNLPLNNLSQAEMELHATPISFADLTPWLPTMKGDATLDFSLSHINDTSRIYLLAKYKSQKITATGRINSANTIKLQIDADSIDGGFWSGNPEFATAITGKINIDATGFDYLSNSINITAELQNKKGNALLINNLTSTISKQQDQLNVVLKSVTPYGEIATQIDAKTIFDKPNISATATVNHLNLEIPTADKRLKSTINLKIKAAVIEHKGGELQTSLELSSDNSKLFGQPIEQLTANITTNGTSYNIDHLIYKAPYLEATISGFGDIANQNLINFKINTKNVESISGALQLDSLHFEARAQGQLEGTMAAMKLKSDYKIESLSTGDITVNNTTGTIQSKFVINTDSASMVDINTAEVSFNSQIEHAAYQSIFVKNTTVNINKNTSILSADISGNTAFGMLNTQLTLTNIFTKPTYLISATIEGFDITHLSKNDTIQSDINLSIKAKGSGFSPKTMVSDIEIKSDSSSIFELPINDFDAKISYKKGSYQLQGCRLETPFMLATASGNGNIDNNNLRFSISSKDISTISARVIPKSMKLRGTIDGELNGRSDSLVLHTQADIRALSFDTISIEHCTSESTIKFVNDGIFGSIDLQLDSIKIQQLDIKKMHLSSQLDNKKTVNTFSFFASDSLNGHIYAETDMTDTLTITLSEIELNLLNTIWQGNSLSNLQLTENSISLTNVGLKSKDRAINAHGTIAIIGDQNLHIEVKNLSLISLPGLQLLPVQTSGTINALFDMTGTSEQPIINGNITIDNPKVDNMAFTKFHIDADYATNMLKFNSTLDDATSRIVNANIAIPFHFAFADDIYLPKLETPIHAQLTVDNLNIDRLNSFVNPMGIGTKGVLNIDILVDSTIMLPQITGTINLSGGGLTYQKLGVDYNNITLNSHLNNNVFTLDSLLLFAGKGHLLAKGIAQSASVTDISLKELDFNVVGENFRAFDSELIRAVINTDIRLKGTPEAPAFSGNLTVLRSILNTDIFLKEFNRVYDDSEQPLLIKARNEAKKSTSDTIINQNKNHRSTPSSYKNLTGQFDINIPRNTWIKGKNMNFELMGTLKAIKKGEQIDVFGNMSVKRGYYKLYGRRLEFEEGDVTLTGGTPISPVINFKIAYKFRDNENVLRKLIVNVTGRATTPEVSFLLDDEPIEEKDAVSYLLFNKSINQLDTKENASMGTSKLDVAKELAIGQFSNVVKDALQSTLGLDVIEISGKNGWTQGSVSVGKYITNNLFLNYERVFSLDKKDNVIEPEKISMEYQFYRSLYLQATNQSANSGFDFIIKWTWK